MKLYGPRCGLLASAFVFVTYGLALAGAQSLGNGVDSRKTGNATGIWPWQEFVTVDYNPPLLEINTTGEKLAPGYVFIAPSNAGQNASVKQKGPVILTDTGDLVWNGPNVTATNFRVQKLYNKSVLTFWEGDSTANAFVGHGYGSVTILDDTYTQIGTVCPQISINTGFPGITPKCFNDLHESQITPRNTILISAYNVTEADLTSVGGPTNGFILDALFFEVALDGSQKVLFQWSSIEHVPVNQSKQPLGEAGINATYPYDYFHINAVDPVGDNYLVNSRHTWSTYFVEPSGEVGWTVQGETGGDFGSLPPGGTFAWQHDSRHHHVTKDSITISWFNNENNEIPAPNATNANATSVIAIRFPLPPNPQTPPTLVNHVTNEPPIFDSSQGAYTYWLPGDGEVESGHQFVGFGQIPLVKEYNAQPKGSSGLLWTARFGADNRVQSYRGFKFVWEATPLTKPTLVVTPGQNASYSNGYVSWNGATQVTSYNVYEGATNSSFVPVGSVQKAGFETLFGVSQKFVQVAAVVGSQEVSRSEVVSS